MELEQEEQQGEGQGSETAFDERRSNAARPPNQPHSPLSVRGRSGPVDWIGSQGFVTNYCSAVNAEGSKYNNALRIAPN
ncbi:hypothetical protein N7466_007214 [Penicillium verhagenii]|uniref:uncharacterized protein n=1 Tax=Penicillium verhagenii TaxID=1562060 RepID=UPI00254541CD|nr:uncharacterized protein N7466_007214 [Penicillium verhagenii]KAJ5928258.1 hypothetical protein N7466_007214 [Penicillium verhagenii]